jgi:predicted HTH domain antitoxin
MPIFMCCLRHPRDVVPNDIFGSFRRKCKPLAAGWTGLRYREDMGMVLNIPDSVLQGLRIPEREIAERLRTELAIALYAQGALSLAKAAELAQMTRMSFGEVVGQRGIARHYGEAEFAQDVSYAGSE